MVRARIRRIEAYSAHADQGGLVAWLNARRPVAGTIFLSHGEPKAIEALRDLVLAADPMASVVMPEIGETYALGTKSAAARTRTADPQLQTAIGLDWQNSYADFAANLKHDLSRIRDAEARERAVRDMRAVLASYTDARAAQKSRRHPARASG